jgi:hypothetical protein
MYWPWVTIYLGHFLPGSLCAWAAFYLGHFFTWVTFYLGHFTWVTLCLGHFLPGSLCAWAAFYLGHFLPGSLFALATLGPLFTWVTFLPGPLFTWVTFYLGHFLKTWVPGNWTPHPRVSRKLRLLEMCVEMSTKRRVWVSRGQKTLQKYPPPPPMPEQPPPPPPDHACFVFERFRLISPI